MKYPVLALISLVAIPAIAQEFRVTDMSPHPGQVQVEVKSTVSFAFSAPIDTSARFDGEDPLAFYTVAPTDSIEVHGRRFSEDLTQVFFDVTHRDSTDYVWILTGARSQTGGQLCNSAVMAYSTGPNRGDAVVHGNAWWVVLLKSGPCGPKMVVVLLDSPLDTTASVVAAAEASYGEFRIEGVRPGTYWPALLIDIDMDGVFRPVWSRAGDVFSELGVYDADGDWVSDSLVVTDTTEIEITLFASGGSREGAAELPGTARLLQNYPNPFAGSTQIVFEIERPLSVALAVYDMIGRKVSEPAAGLYVTGRHTVDWDARNLAAGLYAVRLEGDGFVLVRPLVLSR